MDYLKALNLSDNQKELNTVLSLIINDYSKLLFKIAYEITKNEENSKDIVIISFEELYFRRKSVRSIKAFLVGIAKYRALSSLDYHKGEVDYDFTYYADKFQINDYIEKVLLINNIKKELTVFEMTAFIYIYIFDFSLNEVAIKLGVSLRTIKRINKKILDFGEKCLGSNNCL